MKELTVVYQGFGQAVPIGTLADNCKGTPRANSEKIALKSMAKKVSCLRFSALRFGPIHAFKQGEKI